MSANFSVNYVEGLFFRTAYQNEFPSAGWRSIWGSVFRSQLGWVWAWQTNREAALDKACKNTLQQTSKQYYIHVYTFHALFSSYTHIHKCIYTVCQHPQRSILLIYIYICSVPTSSTTHLRCEWVQWPVFAESPSCLVSFWMQYVMEIVSRLNDLFFGGVNADCCTLKNGTLHLLTAETAAPAVQEHNTLIQSGMDKLRQSLFSA